MKRYLLGITAGAGLALSIVKESWLFAVVWALIITYGIVSYWINNEE